MKVIILAAGMGSRLDPTENHEPKALTKLANQQSILAWQLQALASYELLDHTWVVVGYRKEAIIEAFPDLGYIYNPHFQQENTSKSLLRALKKVDEDVLWLNGDVVFRPIVLESLLNGDMSAMLVNRTVVGEEEVKYRATEEGRLLEVSKQVKNPQGEAVGINFFRKNDLTLLRQALEQCQPTDYFEKAIEVCIQQGQTIWTCPVKVEECTEIDFPKDLEHANQLIAQWT
jgi:L-glutamine-phosphate cytidylyltransferase